jgi:hypothetical protein
MSAKFKVRFKTVRIDEAKWRARMDARLTKQLKKAATVWLNATVLLVIPVWSGASRGTFLKLARAVGFPLTVTGIKGSSRGFSGSTIGPRAGFQRSEGSISTNEGSGRYTFRYETDLFQLVFNEFENANQNPTAGRLFSRLLQPGPYNFQEIGKDAFEDYVSSTTELPSPWRALKFKKLRRG